MPRRKRDELETPVENTSIQVVAAVTQGEQASVNQGQEKTGRPKRIRKATQQFTSTSTTAPPKKQRATRKAVARTTGKGNGKAAGPVAEGASGNQSRTEDTTGEPTKKKARTTKQSAPKEEKRLAQFRSHCPQNVLERAERVRTQRFFMIERKREGKNLKEEFKVLGSTANVYTVTIDHKPKCSCPDNAIRGNHCKHIMFIFLKVLLVPITSHIWYQKALLTSELETVFAQAPEAPNSVIHPRVLDAYLRATGQKGEASTAATSSSKKRIPGEEDDCPICYDTMYGVAEAALTFCEECGNALHKECFEQYQKSARQTGKEITCVWCRSSWGVTTSSKSAGAATQQGGFINLADAVPDLNAHRDTSTYYHGPRRGQLYYGYNQYTS